MVTLQQLSKIFPNSSPNLLENFVDPINKAIEEYDINNPAMFLAQVGHESGGFKTLVENLNYSSDRLLVVFPKYFNATTAKAYHRQPQKIANRVYANRMGKGDEASGDGWKYRGKGAIQITGKNNHKLFAESVGKTIDEAVDYMLTPEGAIMSAGWFWDYVNCNETSSSVTQTTKKINGGTNGLDDRRAYYTKAQAVLGNG